MYQLVSNQCNTKWIISQEDSQTAGSLVTCPHAREAKSPMASITSL